MKGFTLRSHQRCHQVKQVSQIKLLVKNKNNQKITYFCLFRSYLLIDLIKQTKKSVR